MYRVLGKLVSPTAPIIATLNTEMIDKHMIGELSEVQNYVQKSKNHGCNIVESD